MSTVTCWTATDLETQPRVRASGPGLVEVTMLVGVWTQVPFAMEVVGLAEISDADGWHRVDASALTSTEITAAELTLRDLQANAPTLAYTWLESTRHLADIRLHLDAQRTDPASYPANRYFEVVIGGLPAGGQLRFVAEAVVGGGSVRARSKAAGLWLVAPDFSVDDVVASHTFDHDQADDQWWVLMHTADADFDHLRLDLLQTRNLTRRPPPAGNLAPITVELDGTTYDLTAGPGIGDGAADPGFASVRVDRSTDSVLITRRRRAEPLRQVMITTRADGDHPDRTAVDVITAPRDVRPVAVMIIAYAIQGLNDLFVEPVAGYDPPRSFAEIAFSDEHARFSGRPETVETTVGDGYRFVLNAQRGYGVRCVWAFNSGALLLLRHSLPSASYAELTQAVHSGLVSVANAGIGAHRNSRYQAETNVQEIARADELITRVLAHSGVPARPNRVYFPDSRIYQATPAELDSYATLVDSGVVDSIVLDRSTVAHGPAGEQQQRHFGNDTPQVDEGNHLWRDERTGLKLLLIEDRLRDRLVAGSEDEVPRGQLDYHLRRLFLRSLDQSRARPRQLFCFGDDIDHLAGNGWFDGNYTNAKAFTHAFLAATCWLDQHPWMAAVTPDDPGFEADFLRTDRTLSVDSAIDATMDPGGAATQRYPSSPGVSADPWLHFDAWAGAWEDTPAPWLGTTLGEMSHALENALVSWPAAERNELSELAWLYFLSCTHESMWSKQPVEQGAPRPLDQPFRWEPEDFVISESLQLRNAWVYLNAAVWARWAETSPTSGSFVLDADTLADPAQSGGLLDRIRAAHTADAWWPGAPSAGHGLYWDRDPLANVVLYNADVLAVLDRNGGRITQLFCRVGGRPVSVSGTNKAYQFLEIGPPQIACDGQRVQNTVYTPNHAYLATDLVQARPRPGYYSDQRNPTGANPTWLPDNFNTYACTGRVEQGRATVTAAYVPTATADLPPGGLLSWADHVEPRCVTDGVRLRAGQPGVVWHESPGFTKTITLDGRRLHVAYARTEPGHLVANEFSVDLHDLLRGGPPQRRVVGAKVASVGTAAGLEVRLRLGGGCEFTPEARRPRSPGTRVLTEDVQIRAIGGGDFDYTIELPG